MSEQFDSYLVSIGMALSRKEIDVARATEMLSAPEVIDNIDGSNVQQLIRLSLMTSMMDKGSESLMLAEVGVLLGMIKPELEIDFGLQVGVSNAQSCALFAMYSISFQRGNLPASLAILEGMIPSLNAAGDRKGLLEVLCWLGILQTDTEQFGEAVSNLSAGLALLNEPETIDALEDNSALDMVRSDNKNVFSFPRLRFLETPEGASVEAAIRDLLRAGEQKHRS
ncbi:hypothetical protein [Bradyrhizobium sp. P5_C12]